MNNIALMPHLYDIKWSRDLNKHLSEHMLVAPFQEDTYMPSKSLKNDYISRILPLLRKEKINTLFFTNFLEDFSMDFIKASPVKKIYGLIHGSNFIKTEMGQNNKLKEYEVAISKSATKLFVATKFLQEQVPYETEVIGLPITYEMKEPNDKMKIMFNHRLAKEKNPLHILELPELKDRFIISTPKAHTNTLGILKKEIKEFHFRVSDLEYEKLMGECGYGVSFSKHDTFGYATVEGIFNGLCYFVPKNDTTSYKELVIDELQYSDISDLKQKIEYFDNNIEERKLIVKKAQKKVQKYYYKDWIARLFNIIGLSLVKKENDIAVFF